MADYFQVKNQNIFNPPANTSLGNTSTQFSNVYVQNNLVVGNVSVTGSTIITPRVTTITYPGNDTAADTAGGQTITLTGSGFVAGAGILINSITVSVVSVVSSTVITFTSPANTTGSYVLYVINSDGSTAISIPGIQYSGTPAWTTTAGSLGSVYEYSPISNSTTATGDGSITYSVFSGTLPTSSSLNTSTGVITGTSPASAGATTYTFVIRATDAQLQDSDRSFSITVNIDPVTWTSPADNSTVTLNQNAASTTALSATSAAGKAITYTSTALPAGLSISGAAVTGTPTVLGTTATTFTATAATTGRTTTATINWTVSVANDPSFPYTTLLLSGAAATETFVSDASANNFAVTIVGDTKPSNFNPYTPGYYSNYFNGSGDYLSVASNAAFNLGTGDFTLEAWVYRTAAFTDTFILSASGTGGMFFGFTGSTIIGYGRAGVAWDYQGASHGMSLNTWYHVTLTRSGTSIRIFVNGGQVGVTQTSSQAYDLGVTSATIGGQGGSYYWTGYISNARIVKGTAVYTGNFAVPTAPLTAIANTSLLTCQSNRFLDNSTNLFAITRAGSTSVQSFTPFVPNTAYATQGSTYFDGTTDNLAAPSSSQFNLPGDFTIECWIHRTVNVDVIGLFGIGSTDPDSNLVRIVSGVLQFWLGGSNSGASGTGTKTGQINCSTVLLYNTWYHVALVRSGSAANNVKLYLNGVLDGQGTGTYQVPTNSFVIGKSYPGYAGEYFNGYISNVRVVKGVAVYTGTFTPPTTPLSATQASGTNIAAITGTQTSLLTCQTNQPASNSMFLDSSTNAFPVTRAGNTSAGTFTPYGANWSNYFDGTGDYFQTPASSMTALIGATAVTTTSTFTVECWVYQTQRHTYASAPVMLGDQGTNGSLYWTFGPDSTGKLTFYWYTGAQNLATGNDTIPLNTWTHVAVSISSGVIKLFVNGVLQTITGSSSTSNQSGAFGYLMVGQTYTGGTQYGYYGYISNLRITKLAVYTGTFTPPTAPLTAIANTGLLTCQSNSLVDNSANAFTISKYGDVAVQRFSPFAPQTQTAITHSAYFDGASDYLTVPTNAAFQLGTDSYTFEAWIYPTALGVTNTNNIINIGTYTTGLLFRVYGATTGFEIYTNNTQRLATSTGLTANSWQHIALVRNVSACTLYINGQINGTFTDTSSISPATATLIIGMAAHNSSEFFTGYMSNYRLVKGVAVYTAAFTVPTAPLTAIQSAGTNIAAITGTQTSLLTCQSPTFTDNSTNAFAITAFGDTKPRTFNPFGFTNASAAYSAATYGGSAYFDGNADYLTLLTNPPTYAYKSGNFCLECWHYMPTAFSGYQYLVSFWNSAPYKVVILGYDGSTTAGRPTFYWTTNGSTDKIITASNAVPINQWNHIAVMRTANTISLFVNGVRVATASESGTLNSTGLTGMSTIMAHNAGAEALTPGYLYGLRSVIGSNPYDATLTTLAVPTAPLTAITNTSLLLNMTSAGVYDSASMSNLETVADAKLVATHTPYAGSFYSNYFDGTGDYLSTPQNAAFNLTANFTVELWFNFTAAPGASAYTFIGNYVGSSAGWALQFRGDFSNRFRFIYGDTAILDSTTQTIIAGTWYHLAASRSGGVLTIYLNGSSIGSITNSVSYTSSVALWIGGLNGVGQYFPGFISNSRVVNGTAVYTGNFAVPTAPLTATQAGNGATISAITTGTSLLTCQSNRFVDNSANAFAITKYDNASIQSFNPFQRNSAATMYFDGTGDYLKAPYNPAFAFGIGDFTIECWLYQVVFTSDMVITASFTTWSSSVNFYFGTRAGSPNILIFRAGDTVPIYLNGNTGLTTNTWTHVAVSRASGVTRMFVNGVTQSATHTGSVNIGTTAQPTGIGADNAGTESINAYINDLRITKGVARYTGTFTPSTSAFITK